MIEFAEKDDGVIFTVRVTARASKSVIVGEHDGALKVRIASPPVDGAANAELVKLFAATFAVAKSEVEILSGQTSKTKRVRLRGVTAEDFLRIARRAPV